MDGVMLMSHLLPKTQKTILAFLDRKEETYGVACGSFNEIKEELRSQLPIYIRENDFNKIVQKALQHLWNTNRIKKIPQKNSTQYFSKRI